MLNYVYRNVVTFTTEQALCKEFLPYNIFPILPLPFKIIIQPRMIVQTIIITRLNLS